MGGGECATCIMLKKEIKSYLLVDWRLWIGVCELFFLAKWIGVRCWSFLLLLIKVHIVAKSSGLICLSSNGSQTRTTWHCVIVFDVVVLVVSWF